MNEHESDAQLFPEQPAESGSASDQPTANIPHGEQGSPPAAGEAPAPPNSTPAGEPGQGYQPGEAGQGYQAGHPGPGFHPGDSGQGYQPGQPGQGYQPGQSYQPGHAPGYQPGQAGYHQVGPGAGWAYAQQPGYGGGQQHHPWPYAGNQPYNPPTDPHQGSGRTGRWVATGLLALLLAGGGGVVGGVVAHAADHNNATVASGSSGAAAPVLDRSSLAGIVAKAEASVVSIKTQNAEGSGVILTGDGYILTNNHVVATASGDSVQVLLSNGKTVSASIVGTDPKSDLAVIKAKASGLQAAKFGDSSAMRPGDSVFAVGSPLGLDGSVTSGIISATNRTITEGADQQQNPFQRNSGSQTTITGLLQTDAAINPGNSGGALVNLNGEVIGINTAIATSGGGEGNIGVGFAIPGNHAKQVADQLIKGGKVAHPYLGVQVTDSQNGDGAVISQVVSGGPAEQAGLKQGDVITKVGDTDVKSSNDLVAAIQAAKPGDKLPLTVTRDGSSQTITVTLGSQ